MGIAAPITVLHYHNHTSVMELPRRNFRVMIYYDYMKGLKQQSVFETWVATLGKQAPARATVLNGTMEVLDEMSMLLFI